MIKPKNQSSLTSKGTNLVLLVIALALGFVTYFSFLELLLTIGALVINQGIDGEFRQKYSLVMLRNVWLVVGAIIGVCLIVGCSANFGKRLGERRALRWPLRIVALELVIIGLAILTTGRII